MVADVAADEFAYSGVDASMFAVDVEAEGVSTKKEKEIDCQEQEKEKAAAHGAVIASTVLVPDQATDDNYCYGDAAADGLAVIYDK